MKKPYLSLLTAALCVMAYVRPTFAQSYARSVTGSPRLIPNVTYIKRGAWEGKIDIYAHTTAVESRPTVVWVHGGDPFSGTKDYATFNILPYLEWGWNVVNVEHMQPGVTLAPEALQNCLCALRWIIHNSHEYHFDTTKLVIAGPSSGGWFAVAAGLSVRPDNWDQACPGSEDPKVAAIVNWYGNWDLADLLEGPNSKSFAPGWVRGLPNPLEVARILSPLPLRRGVPPVISVHGDADPTVPYTQSLRLHQALKAAGESEELITIPGGGHGGFSREENQRAFVAIERFLAKQNIRPN